jgi:predicted Rossmann fold nucleotide-binding protein DprA/Smf involved in DNA uptake
MRGDEWKWWKQRSIRVAIVGSRQYLNNRKIKDFIYRLKEKYGEEVEIVSGGQPLGADGIAKHIALEFGMNYIEFPPAHYKHNIHCKLSAEYYGKKYYVSNFFKRNKQIAEYSDIVVAFIPDGIESRGTMNTVKYATEMKKLIKIFN